MTTPDQTAVQMVHELLHDTETAVRTFQRTYRWREAAKVEPYPVVAMQHRSYENSVCMRVSAQNLLRHNVLRGAYIDIKEWLIYYFPKN